MKLVSPIDFFQFHVIFCMVSLVCQLIGSGVEEFRQGRVMRQYK